MMQIWFVFATEYVALWDLEISGEKKKRYLNKGN